MIDRIDAATRALREHNHEPNDQPCSLCHDDAVVALAAADAVERPVAQKLADALRGLEYTFADHVEEAEEPDVGAPETVGVRPTGCFECEVAWPCAFENARAVLAEWDATQEPVPIPRDPKRRAALADEAGLTAEERAAVEAWVQLQQPPGDQYTLDDPPPWINKHRYGPT